MLELSLFVTASALVDSLSTTQQIVFLILLFSTQRPIRTSLGFIVGVTGAYLLCGLVALAFVDKLNALVNLFIPHFDTVDDRAFYQAQVLLGLGLFVAGPLYWLYRARSKRPPMDNRLIQRVKAMNFTVALGLGAFLSTTSFPMALPYIAALEKIAATPMGPLAQGGFVLLYNGMYAVPLLVPFGLFVALKEAILPQLHLHVQRLNVVVMILLLSGMGLFFVVDAGAFLVGGAPLVPRPDTMFAP